MICNEYKKIMKSPAFWICVLGFLLCLFIGDWESLIDHGLLLDGTHLGALYVFETSVGYGIGVLAVPVFSVIPSAYLYLEEANGYQKYYLLRTDLRTYLRGKIAAALLSAISLILISSLCYISFLLVWEHGWGEGIYIYENTIYEGWQNQGYYAALFLLDLLSLICLGIEWPVASLAISTFTENKYIVLVLPFLLHLLLNYIGEVAQLPWLMPGWIGTTSYNVYEAWGGWRHTLIYLLVLIGFSCFVFVRRIRRSLVYG